MPPKKARLLAGHPFTTSQVHLNLNGNNNITQITLKRNEKKPYTKTEIARVLTLLADKYKDQKFKFMLGVEVPDLGWRDGKIFDNQFNYARAFKSHETPIFVSTYSWETTQQFVIYMWKYDDALGKPHKLLKVGNSALNDCCWELLCEARIPMNDIPFEYRSAAKLKSLFGLQRNDKIPVEGIINILQDKIKTRINITGDLNYVSEKLYQRVIDIVVKNGHCSLNNSLRDKNLIAHNPNKVQTLVLYFFRDIKAILYNGIEIENISAQELYDRKKDYYGNYAYVKTDASIRELEKGKNWQGLYSKVDKTDADLIKEYNTFMYSVDQLYDATQGSIDMKRYGYNVVRTIKTLFYSEQKSIEDGDDVSKEEEPFLEFGMQGGIIYSNKGQLETAYEYDLNSCYPYFMSSDHFTFPLKRGEIKTLQTLDAILSYGIYRCEIIGSHPFFKFNNQNYYTHFDLTCAKELGLEIKLIVDEKPNALLYTSKRSNGNIVFKKLIDYLFELKVLKVPFAKNLITALWGALSQKNKETIVSYYNKPALHIEDCEIMGIWQTPFGDKIEYRKNGRNLFKYKYGRLGCFLTSYVRLKMHRFLFPFEKYIHRIHTDGFICNEKLPLSISDKLGGWKVKEGGSCEILNCNLVKWA